MPDNLKLLKNIFAELEKPLFFGDGLSSGEFHSLMQPGQFISPNLMESQDSDDMHIQASLTDDLIDTKFIYTPLPGSISDQYRQILETAALPYRAITPGEQRDIDDINAWVAKNEPAYRVFATYYYDAKNAYEQGANQEPPSTRLQELLEKVNKARNDWNTLGKRMEYESKQARAIYLSSGDPSTIWNEFRARYAYHSKVGPRRGSYMQNFLLPPVSQWNSPGTSWALFEKTINESSSYDYSHTTEWGGGGGAGWGLFSINVGGGGSSSYSYHTSDVSTVKIHFEYLRVRIDRPWLRSDIFGYRWWWWKAAFGYRRLSDGGNLYVTPPIRPIGPFPFLPQHMIVAKNVQITANFTHDDQTIINSNIGGNMGLGYGPFSLNGHYSESTSEKTVHASFDGTTISIPYPQIIAFTGPLLPLTPNPDRSLPWQEDHAPFDPPPEQIAADEEIRAYESDALIRQINFESARAADLDRWQLQWEEQRRELFERPETE